MNSVPPKSSHRGFSRLRRLTQKELRETLRDRRTVVTLLLMPLLVYPLLSLVFRTFLLSGVVAVPTDQPISYKFLVHHNTSSADFERWFGDFIREATALEKAETPLLRDMLAQTEPKIARLTENEFRVTQEDIEAAVSEGTADAGIVVTFRSQPPHPREAPTIEFVIARNNSVSVDAAHFIRNYFSAVNHARVAKRIRTSSEFFNLDERTFIAAQKNKSVVSFGTLIPLILVLMTITGAVYPAIDLTAGERERGTIEALIAAPIPRMRILIAKFFAVLTVAMLTATLNLIGMLVTVWAFRLEHLVFVGGAPSALAIAQVFGLLLLYAAFFSSLLLAITSLARSFKEAQAYLIPLILLAMAPSLVSLAPGLSISGPLAIVPMVNFVLLARDIFQGQVAIGPCLIVIASTVLYSIVALGLASRIFGTDAILYGSHESLKDSLRRPTAPQPTASPFLAVLCLVLLFAANFLTIAVMSRMAEQPIELQLLAMAVFTIAAFVGIPALLAFRQRIGWGSGFGIRGFRFASLVAVVIMGVSLWPLTVFLINAAEQLLTLFGGSQAAEAFQQRLIAGGKEYVDRWRLVPIGLILLTHSIIPAVAEEWFFRGFLLQSLLRRSATAWKPVVFTGVAFGLFHLLAQSSIAVDRLLPTTLMGILLGYVAWRTGSIVPGMILHTLHNGTVVSLAYFHEELAKIEWLPLAEANIPTMWLLGISAIAVVGFVILQSVRPPKLAIASELPAVSDTGEAAPTSLPLDSR